MKLRNLFSKNKEENQRLSKDVSKIEKTRETPEVILDKNTPLIKIEGSSYPEDATIFYNQVLKWIDENSDSFTSAFICEFYYDFLSSSSHKMVYEIMRKIHFLHENGINVTVKWYYEESDDDIMEKGEDFAKLIDIPFEIVCVES